MSVAEMLRSGEASEQNPDTNIILQKIMRDEVVIGDLPPNAEVATEDVFGFRTPISETEINNVPPTATFTDNREAG